MRAIIFLTAILFLTVSCIGLNKTDRVYKTAHFAIFYTSLDGSTIHEIADSLEVGYPKIRASLHSEDIPLVNVHFYEDFAGLSKVFPDLPNWAAGQATSVTEIHMISPNNKTFDYHNMIRNVKHEFAHCVSMKINSTISNKPRWLWESVALYQANFPWDPHMLPYLVKQTPPSLKELNEFSNPKIYEVGYFIGQYIAETHGTAAFNSLIQNNGNLRDTLNVSDEEFTKQWFAFVKRRYGI